MVSCTRFAISGLSVAPGTVPVIKLVKQSKTLNVIANMRIVWRILKWVAIVLIVVFIGIQFVRPGLTNPPVDESQTIFARLQVPPEVASILNRSCRDCHSNQTVWPWYTQVAPVSWWLKNHVDQGPTRSVSACRSNGTDASGVLLTDGARPGTPEACVPACLFPTRGDRIVSPALVQSKN